MLKQTCSLFHPDTSGSKSDARLHGRDVRADGSCGWGGCVGHSGCWLPPATPRGTAAISWEAQPLRGTCLNNVQVLSFMGLNPQLSPSSCFLKRIRYFLLFFLPVTGIFFDSLCGFKPLSLFNWKSSSKTLCHNCHVWFLAAFELRFRMKEGCREDATFSASSYIIREVRKGQMQA